MTNENTLRWSGLAAASGGILWLLPWTGWLGEIESSTGFLMALVGILLVAIGLFGLYQRLPAGGRSNGHTIAFGAALAGDLMIMASAIGGLLSGASFTAAGQYPILAALLGAGILLITLGLAGMGIMAISAKALGALSFAPLLLAIALVGYVVSVGVDIGADNGLLRTIADVVTIGCWLLLGVALWTAKEPEADPALQA